MSTELITRTIVIASSDGTRSVKRETITRAQQLAEIAEREALVHESLQAGQPAGGVATTQSALISLDSSCAGSSLWLFSGPNLTGSEICFSGDGNGGATDLANYTLFNFFFFNISWAGQVHSWWAGNLNGIFAPAANFPHPTCTEECHFTPYQRQDNPAPNCGTGAEYVGFTELCGL